jgi:hypothetical protein
LKTHSTYGYCRMRVSRDGLPWSLVLALGWRRLQFTAEGVATNLNEVVAEPLLAFAGRPLDVRAILLGLLPGRSAADGVARPAGPDGGHRI